MVLYATSSIVILFFVCIDRATSLSSIAGTNTASPAECFESDRIFRVAPNAVQEYKIIIKPNAPIVDFTKRTHYEYYVYNMGRTKLKLNFQYGDIQTTSTEEYELESEKEILVSRDKNSTYAEVKIRNLSPDTVGYAYVQRNWPLCINRTLGNIQEPSTKMPTTDWSKFGKYFSASLNSAVGRLISPLVEFIWPEDEPDVWSRVETRLKNIIDGNVLQSTKNLTICEIEEKHTRIKQFENDLRRKSDEISLRVRYMNIAQDLIGFEKRLGLSSFTNIIRRFVRIPQYSIAALTRVWYYTIGISGRVELGLTDTDVVELEEYRKNTLKDAETELPKLFEDRLQAEYDAPEGKSSAYYNFVRIRNLYSEYGSEYLKIMKAILANESLIRWDEVYFWDTIIGANTFISSSVQMEIDPYYAKIGKLTKIVTRWLKSAENESNAYLVGIEVHDDKDRPVRTNAANDNVSTIRVDLGERQVNRMVAKLKGDIVKQLVFFFNDNSDPSIHGIDLGSDREIEWNGRSEYVLSSLLYSSVPVNWDFNSYEKKSDSILVAYRRANATLNLNELSV